MKHLACIDAAAPGRKNLTRKAAGRFYTPEWMAERLVCTLTKDYELPRGRVCVVDPFCGDGRLIAALINLLPRSCINQRAEWHFELWDNDVDALAEATCRVEKAIHDKKLAARLVARHWDSLLDSPEEFEKFDIVVTNPPWETLKPDSRELGGLAAESRQIFQAGLREYDTRLAQALPYSQPSKKLYGWGTNLSRCGLELSVKLLRVNGRCGIVLPGSILADQTSLPLRRWSLTQAKFLSIDHYPAEAKPFDAVDQPSVIVTVERGSNSGTIAPLVTQFDRARKQSHSSRLVLHAADLETLDWRIPVELNNLELSLLLKLSRLKPLSELEVTNGGTLWLGRELDETGYHSFVTARGVHPFVKGRHIGRFSKPGGFAEFIREGAREIPSSANFERIVWRDVSRRSQTRRMVATIIPPGSVTGNSLQVGYFTDGNPQRLRALAAVMSSLVFEFQLRSRLGTGHVSVGSVRGIRVPSLKDPLLVRELAELVDLAINGDASAELEIEAAVARAAKMSVEEFDALVGHFTTLESGFKEKLRAIARTRINRTNGRNDRK